MADVYTDAESLLAADVVELSAENEKLLQENRIYREMISEALALTHQAIAYIATREL
jgi:hypothetical protein